MLWLFGAERSRKEHNYPSSDGVLKAAERKDRNQGYGYLEELCRAAECRRVSAGRNRAAVRDDGHPVFVDDAEDAGPEGFIVSARIDGAI